MPGSPSRTSAAAPEGKDQGSATHSGRGGIGSVMCRQDTAARRPNVGAATIVAKGRPGIGARGGTHSDSRRHEGRRVIPTSKCHRLRRMKNVGEAEVGNLVLHIYYLFEVIETKNADPKTRQLI